MCFSVLWLVQWLIALVIIAGIIAIAQHPECATYGAHIEVIKKPDDHDDRDRCRA
jgi:hypothetical protein